MTDPTSLSTIAGKIKANIGRVMVGKAWEIELLLVALFSQGHVLLEDIPGVGKTTLAKSLAASLGCNFRRIQFTPDLLPSDIIGVSVFNQKSNEFQYRPGPIVTQILLADEINRAGPRTQSALLEAMQERQVTVDGESWPLPGPFLVLATQNPIELEGTFQLPEAQLDRFLLCISLGYPARPEEREIFRRFQQDDPLTRLEAVISAEQIEQATTLCRQIFVHPVVEDYLLDIVEATRSQESIRLGASPRASLALYRAGQTLAALRGYDYVLPDHIKTLAGPVLAHRLILSAEARLHDQTAPKVLAALLEQVPVPVEEAWREPSR